VRLEFKAEAEDDLVRIFEFNMQRSETWAHRVESRLLDRCEELLRTRRLRRALKEANTFRLSVTDIQYVIDYQLAEDLVLIARILSTREVR
jgi:plasmid stabilization system protein ParE